MRNLIEFVFIFNTGGVGAVIWPQVDEADVREDDHFSLSIGFISAIQAFGRDVLNEIQYIQMVPRRMVFLPSQHLFTLMAVTSNDLDPYSTLHFLEDVRDQILEKYWDEIKSSPSTFFSKISYIMESFFPIVDSVIAKWDGRV